jgi:hypothetical protein
VDHSEDILLLTHISVLEKKLRYQISHPISDARNWQEKISPSRILHNLGWMSAMVSTTEAKQVFGRAFSRPPRLLFTNPVCFLFSAYYSYIYGMPPLVHDTTSDEQVSSIYVLSRYPSCLVDHLSTVLNFSPIIGQEVYYPYLTLGSVCP